MHAARLIKHSVTCGSCKKVRLVSYCQFRNFVTGKSGINCLSCASKAKFSDVSKKAFDAYRSDPIKQKEAAKKRIGIKRPYTSEVLKKRHAAKLCAQYTESGRMKMSLAKLGKCGPLASRWEGGKTKERITITGRKEYRDLRRSIFDRDDYTCAICGGRGGNLQMDHILEWCNYPDKRMEPSNLRTICKSCHKKTDNYGNKATQKGRQLCLIS